MLFQNEVRIGKILSFAECVREFFLKIIMIIVFLFEEVALFSEMGNTLEEIMQQISVYV